jgi:hypothetical protein
MLGILVSSSWMRVLSERREVGVRETVEQQERLRSLVCWTFYGDREGDKDVRENALFFNFSRSGYPLSYQTSSG